jgi:hypothetical protein
MPNDPQDELVSIGCEVGPVSRRFLGTSGLRSWGCTRLYGPGDCAACIVNQDMRSSDRLPTSLEICRRGDRLHLTKHPTKQLLDGN